MWYEHRAESADNGRLGRRYDRYRAPGGRADDRRVLSKTDTSDGPPTHARVIAVNVAGTNTVIAITLVAAAFQQSTFLDVALVYALLNFLLSIAFSTFNVERGGVL